MAKKIWRSPLGKGIDPLANFVHDWPEWGLGTPAVVLDIPAQTVPAYGVVDYQYPTVTNPLDHDVWVRAADILPGDRAALHHVITTFRPPGQGSGRSRFGGRGSGGLERCNVPAIQFDEPGCLEFADHLWK